MANASATMKLNRWLLGGGGLFVTLVLNLVNVDMVPIHFRDLWNATIGTMAHLQQFTLNADGRGPSHWNGADPRQEHTRWVHPHAV